MFQSETTARARVLRGLGDTGIFFSASGLHGSCRGWSLALRRVHAIGPKEVRNVGTIGSRFDSWFGGHALQSITLQSQTPDRLACHLSKRVPAPHTAFFRRFVRGHVHRHLAWPGLVTSKASFPNLSSETFHCSLQIGPASPLQPRPPGQVAEHLKSL